MNAKPLFLLVVSLGITSSAFPQGMLTPPGAPAPTMKTLDQIEPRVLITSLPFAVNSPGSYVLTGNPIIGGSNGITVNADNVTIDLNGFEMVGGGGAGSGIAITGVHSNITIRNGTLLFWPSGGVAATTNNTEVHVEKLRVISCGPGITLGNNGTAEDCEVRASSGSGISGGVSCKAIKCSAISQTGATSDGISLGNNSLVRDCVANGNGRDGILVGLHGTIQDCVANENSSVGISTDDGAAIANCSASSNSSIGINGGDGSTLSNCTAQMNGFHGINVGQMCTLHQCTASTNTGSGIVTSTAAALNNCVAHGNLGSNGITVSFGSIVSNSVARANSSSATSSFGINAGGESTVVHCTSTNNTNTNATPTSLTGIGIFAGTGSTITDCTAQGNKGDGIRVSSNSVVAGNVCDQNGFNTGDGAGIHTTSTNNRVEGNNVTNNDRGIDVDSTASLIIKNTAATNSIDYVIALSNRYGPIINITAAGAAAVNGNSAVSTLTSTDAWANYSY